MPVSQLLINIFPFWFDVQLPWTFIQLPIQEFIEKNCIIFLLFLILWSKVIFTFLEIAIFSNINLREPLETSNKLMESHQCTKSNPLSINTYQIFCRKILPIISRDMSFFLIIEISIIRKIFWPNYFIIAYYVFRRLTTYLVKIRPSNLPGAKINAFS